MIDHTGRRGIQNTRVRIPNTKPHCSIDLPACTAPSKLKMSHSPKAECAPSDGASVAIEA